MKIGDTYIPINDGEDIFFANTHINDGSNKSELLQLMLRKEAFYNTSFPTISNAVQYFKGTEGSRGEMCKSVKLYVQNYTKESVAQERAKTIMTLLQKGKTLLKFLICWIMT